MVPDGMSREARQINSAIYVGLGATVLLMAVKIGVGVWGKSRALLYDGFESLVDIFVLSFVLQALRIAARPADRDHPFGHTKVESLASFVVGLTIIVFGLYLGYTAALSLTSHHVARPHWLSFVVAVLTVGTKEALYLYTHRIAQRYASPSLAAIAYDHHKDALSSLITILGTLSAFVAVPFLDDGAALATAIIILWMGISSTREGAMNLIDTSPDAELVEKARESVVSVPGVIRLRELRARKTGRFVHVDAKIEVDRDITVDEGHEIARSVKKAVFDSSDRVRDVIVHVEPHNGTSSHRDETPDDTRK